MSNLSNLASAGGLAATVYGITGKTEDSAAAAGYGAWVESVTGSYPSVGAVQLNGRTKAQVSLSQGQIVAMQQWLDSQIQSTVFPKGGKSDSTLDIQFGPVIGPLAAKYVILILAAGFLAGWFGHRIFK